MERRGTAGRESDVDLLVVTESEMGSSIDEAVQDLGLRSESYVDAFAFAERSHLLALSMASFAVPGSSI